MNDDLFKKALAFELKIEGGYVNNPKDKGGATNKGITQRTYNHYRQARCLPNKDVKFITDKEVEAIYHQYYWLEVGCHNMTDKFAVLCFDSAINHGTGKVKQFLQAAEWKYVDKFLKARKEYYDKIVKNNPSQKIFYKGWMNRLTQLGKFINEI